MAVSFGTYYLNAETFEEATGIFTNGSLTVSAPDGTYQFGGVYRVQTNGVLGVPFTCLSCCQSCSSTVFQLNATSTVPVKRLDNKVHTICSSFEPHSGGFIVIEFDFVTGVATSGFPLGLEGIYNSVTTTGVVSRRYGWLPNKYVGDSNEMSSAQLDGGINGSANPPDYNLRNAHWNPNSAVNWDYDYPTSYVTEPALTLPLTTTLPQSLTVNNPEKCYMGIPNSIATAQTVDVKVYSPRPASFGAAGALDVTVNCPSALTGFEASNVSATRSGVCALNPIAATLYNMPVNGTAGVPRLFDRVFTTSNGTSLAAEGFYALNQNTSQQTGVYDWIHVDANGVVLAKGVGCGGTLLTEVISTAGSVSDTLACTNPAIIQTWYHDGAGDAPVATDTMYRNSLAVPAPLGGGYYQAMREYNVIQVAVGSGVISNITNPC